jgi:hypothetical protein
MLNSHINLTHFLNVNSRSLCYSPRHQINLAVLSMKESGSLMQLQNKWWVDRSECSGDERGEGSPETDDELSLQSLSGIFYILMVGLGLALFLASIEFCWGTRKEAKRRKVGNHNNNQISFITWRPYHLISLHGDLTILPSSFLLFHIYICSKTLLPFRLANQQQ